MISLHPRRRRIALAFLMLLAMLPWPAVALAAQLTLTWVDAGDEEGFAVERSEGAAEPFEEIGVTGPGVIAYTDASVAEGATYCYRVRAFDTSTYSSYSNVACGTTRPAVDLVVAKAGAGAGTVISEPSGVICGASCTGSVPLDATVTLTATAAPGSVFTGWSGACTGTEPCTLAMNAPAEVTANFAPKTPTLAVSKAGPAHGTVLSWPSGINCGTKCSRTYSRGQTVSLVAIPNWGFTFRGWSGACRGTGICTVKMMDATTVLATFGPRR